MKKIGGRENLADPLTKIVSPEPLSNRRNISV